MCRNQLYFDTANIRYTSLWCDYRTSDPPRLNNFWTTNMTSQMPITNSVGKSTGMTTQMITSTHVNLDTFIQVSPVMPTASQTNIPATNRSTLIEHTNPNRDLQPALRNAYILLGLSDFLMSVLLIVVVRQWLQLRTLSKPFLPKQDPPEIASLLSALKGGDLGSPS